MKNFRIVSLVAGTVLLVTTFQNCGKAGFDGMQNQQIDSFSSTSMNSQFAYDGSFDQIMYNSCWGTNAINKPAFTTLRAGAYSSSGIGITSDFIKFTKSGSSGVKPIYPATDISALQIKQYLASTAENKGSIPQLSLRSISNYQTVYTPSGGAGTMGVDYTNMLGDLTDDRTSDPMVNLTLAAMGPNSNTVPTPTTNYFPLMGDGQRNLDGTVRYNSNEGLAKNFRNLMNGIAVDGNGNPIAQGILALTYTMPLGKAGPLDARGAGNIADSKKVYGRSYRMQFVQPAGYKYNPDNILNSIVETNMIDGTAGATWDCSRHYKVIRKADFDKNPAICPMDSFANASSQAYRKEMEIVNRQLPAANWMVSVGGGCVVPREYSDGDCYQDETLSNGAAVAVEYTTSNACFQGLPELKSAYGSTPPTNRCAQFITICTRN